MDVEPFGTTPDGREVTAYRFVNQDGLVLRVLDHGATVQSVEVPDGGGDQVNVVLGFADLAGYLTSGDFFGATVGRFANRIRDGDLPLEGRVHALTRNDGDHTLHGGREGFHQRPWTVEDVDDSGIRLSLVSPDGDQGFPGRLRVGVSFRLDGPEVRIHYTAQADAPTVVNLTNHAHLNLRGEGSGTVEQHELTIHADEVTEVGPGLIPTGRLSSVTGTPLDFREPHLIGERLRSSHPKMLEPRGYDHNYVLRHDDGTGTGVVAALHDPASGRTMELLTDQPGLQLYTTNFLDGRHIGTSGSAYRQGDGVALETQHFPDSPHHPEFPSTLLRPDEEFTSSTVWRFGTA